MDPITAAIAVSAATDVVGGLLGFSSSRKRAKQAKRLAENQIRLLDMQTDENLRRMGLNRDRAVGYARAATGASNMLLTGSSARFQDALQAQWNSDMRWEERKAAIERETIRLGGKATASQIKAEGISSLLGGIGGAAKYLGTIE